MDQPAPSPLIRSFERHLRSHNRSERTTTTTTTTYLIALRQADAFLRGRGTTLEVAIRADLEAFMGDLLARRAPSTAATYHKVLKLYAWLAEEEEIPANPMTRMKPPIVPDKPVPIVPDDGLRRLFKACAGTTFEARRDTALLMLSCLKFDGTQDTRTEKRRDCYKGRTGLACACGVKQYRCR